MKGWHLILAGIALAAIGFFMQKKQGGTNEQMEKVRQAKADKKEESNVAENTN